MEKVGVAMTNAKKGPKTELGKKQSAKNSTIHGLRSQNLTSSKEIQDQSNFLQELIDFYKPIDPIEKLQLERIAVCKAKLKTLYDLEKAKYELLLTDLQSNLRTRVRRIQSLKPLAQGIMTEYLVFKTILLPCHLTIDSLVELVEEMNSAVHQLQSEDDIIEQLPKLVKYLNEHSFNGDDLIDKLLFVGAELERVINRGDSYCETANAVFTDRNKKIVEIPSDEELSAKKELDDYIKASNKRRQAEFNIKINVKKKQFPTSTKINEIFNSFRTILEALESVIRSKDIVEKELDLQIKALSLPADEADLLMRYQTSWERRLSTLIGEFTHIRKMRLMAESAKPLLVRSVDAE